MLQTEKQSRSSHASGDKESRPDFGQRFVRSTGMARLQGQSEAEPLLLRKEENGGSYPGNSLR